MRRLHCVAGHSNVRRGFFIWWHSCLVIASSSSLLLPPLCLLLLWVSKAEKVVEWIPRVRKSEGHKGGYYFLSVRDSFASSLFLPFKSYPGALESASTLGVLSSPSLSVREHILFVWISLESCLRWQLRDPAYLGLAGLRGHASKVYNSYLL